MMHASIFLPLLRTPYRLYQAISLVLFSYRSGDLQNQEGSDSTDWLTQPQPRLSETHGADPLTLIGPQGTRSQQWELNDDIISLICLGWGSILLIKTDTDTGSFHLSYSRQFSVPFLTIHKCRPISIP